MILYLGRMKDLHEQLVEAKIKVDMARQKGFLSNEDMGINYVHNGMSLYTCTCLYDHICTYIPVHVHTLSV